MVKSVICEIIENFNQQLILYHDMDALSALQLSSLENNQPYDDINQVLLRRAQLMENISALNEKNRILQRQALLDLGIDEFVLPRLQGCLPVEEINSLTGIIHSLSAVLKSINAKDSRTQYLMAQRKINHTSRINHGNPAQARHAYQQSSQAPANESKEPKK